MRPAFGELLYGAIRDKGFTIPEFAQRQKTSKGRLSKIYSGSLTPPVGAELERWITALRLEKHQASEFREAALLAHAPAEVGALIASLRRELTQVREQHALILRELARLGIQLPEVSNG